uniref:Ankyrin repeat domain-containing protein 33B-like n=1 Tax=Gouania willdenowi TaxID=441366 RepID=A0A8C5I415_GOUWI
TSRPNYWEDEDDIYQEFEELDFDALPDRSDTRSIASDDSFYPPASIVIRDLYRPPSPESPERISFFKACWNNNTIITKIMIRQGVTEEEVRETDRNRRSCLMVACYYGYVDVVMALSHCPYLDVNWQDNEGNTALITAAQAGKHVSGSAQCAGGVNGRWTIISEDASCILTNNNKKSSL